MKTQQIARRTSLALLLVGLSAPLAAQEVATHTDVLVSERPAEIAFEGISSQASSPGVVQEVQIAGEADKSGAVTFSLPGEFLVSGWENPNWRYVMSFGEVRTFRKLIIDLDFMRGQLGPGCDPCNCWSPLYYQIFWLNNGTNWDDMIAYPNYLSNGRLWNETNAGGFWQPQIGQYGLQAATPCQLQQNGWYHLRFVYDTTNFTSTFEITQNGQAVCTLNTGAGISQLDTRVMLIYFGTGYSPEGPEAWTLGWRFANFRAQVLGDEPPGRRPRRR